MPKRFTATEKWNKDWFMDLSLKQKVLWQFLCDSCDCAGVWDPNWRLASLQIGERVKPEDLKAFGDRVVVLRGGKVLLTGFVAYQYGLLSRDCRPHQHVFRAVAKHGIGHLVEGHPEFSGKGIEDDVKGMNRVQQAHKDKEKDKEQDKDKEADNTAHATSDEAQSPSVSEDEIYDAYPKKVGKPDALRKIRTALASPPPGQCPETWPERLLSLTRLFAKCRHGTEPRFIPNPATWFHQQRYADDPRTWENGAHQPSRSDPHYVEPVLLDLLSEPNHAP